jgi:hypothetical protein
MTFTIATIERARAFLNTDAPFLATVAQNQGLTADTVHYISTFYKVRRNLGAARGLGFVANHLNNGIGTWPEHLIGQAEWCMTSAEEISIALDLHHTPYSAITKLAWFLRPTGWTVYDSYARQATRVAGRHGPQPVTDFYNILQEHSFSDAADTIEAILQGTLWSNLSGARVLDSYMMLRGGYPFLLADAAARQGFLAALPGDSGQALSTISNRIEADLAQHPFIQFVEQVQ